jgi:hypothetical protein
VPANTLNKSIGFALVSLSFVPEALAEQGRKGYLFPAIHCACCFCLVGDVSCIPEGDEAVEV